MKSVKVPSNLYNKYTYRDACIDTKLYYTTAKVFPNFSRNLDGLEFVLVKWYREKFLGKPLVVSRYLCKCQEHVYPIENLSLK